VLRRTTHHVSASFAPLDRTTEREAGRRCAALALSGAGASDQRVDTNPDRSPAWPAGFVGSITHKAGFVSACAASADELAGVGIDSEAVIEGAVRAEIAAAVVRPGELARLEMTGQLVEAELFTLLFSAKESVYKCLYPLVRESFGFHDVELSRVDAEQGTFGARLLRHFSVLPDQELEGRFQLHGGLVHSALELRRS
jgi:enterobactin synthetase component D